MKVLFVYPSRADDATNRYRCVHLCEALRAAGHQADHLSAAEEIVTIQHDIVVLHRMRWDAPGHEYAAAARQIGASVVYSADDLVFDLEYAYHTGFLFPDDPLRYRHSKREGIANTETLKNADAALVSTEFLAERAPNARVQVVRNFLGDELLALSEVAYQKRQAFLAQRTDDRVILGYLSGSPTHDGDLADIALPLAEALGHFPQTRLLVAGSVALPSPLRPFEEAGRVTRHPYVPWRELPGLIAQIDINLAPLDLTRPFNHAKSEIKFLEAAAVGVPTIAAASAGFAELPETAGLKRIALQSEWLPALSAWLTSTEARRQAGEAARTSLQVRGTLATDGPALVAQFERLHDGRTAAGSRVIRKSLRSKVVGQIFTREAELFRRFNYLRRHLRLIHAQEKHGGGTA